LLNYGAWGILQVMGNNTAYPKISSLKRIIWQMRFTKVGQCCKQNCRLRRPRLEKAVTVGDRYNV
jgi:hypothetical protein